MDRKDYPISYYSNKKHLIRYSKNYTVQHREVNMFTK